MTDVETLLNRFATYGDSRDESEIRRRLERLERCEAQVRDYEAELERHATDRINQRKRLEKCAAEHAADIVQLVREKDQAVKAVRERLEKCEVVAEYAQHYANCQFLESGIGHRMPCTCGLTDARAALGDK